jgi:hypothetical protein
MNPENWEDILREAHNEPIDPAHYTAVRARVVSRVGLLACPNRAKPGRFFRHLAWISAAVALLLTLALHRSGTPPQPPRITLAIPAAPPAPITRPRPAHLARALRPHREPLTIKLQTSDPNIVIYWIAD